MEFVERELGWKYDLPTPNTPSNINPETNHVYPAPNHICENYLELPRALHKLRGYSSIVGSLLLLAFTTLIIWLFFHTLTSPFRIDF